MKYRIKIEHAVEPAEEGHYSWLDVYEQTVEELDLKAVIATVNELQPATPTAPIPN